MSERLWRGSESPINASSQKSIPSWDFIEDSLSIMSVLFSNLPVGLFGLQMNETSAIAELSTGSAPARRADNAYSPNVGVSQKKCLSPRNTTEQNTRISSIEPLPTHISSGLR